MSLGKASEQKGTAVKKILESRIKKSLEALTFNLEEDYYFSDGLVQGRKLVIDQLVTFSGVRFVGAMFVLGPEAILEFVDCVFEKCDFSNLDLAGSKFYRCRFSSCKLLGADFTNCYFQDVKILDCLLDFANFSSSRMKAFLIQDSQVTEALFEACKFENVQLFHNQLEASNFWETDLSGLDFSSNEFERLEVSPELARNIKINLGQASFFAGLRGIEIV
ncbi:MAG: pentapeptide repeat-containing protein [Streptococcaceae bacterium]|jgi:uncharacterized protein YjbI with pentapeptide repeats|nr:pentapeptide repeat-containing protein [Streptococcaceae bacterium]